MFERVNERILSLRDDPRPHGVHKLAGALDGWRVRVGNYRILYQIDDDAQTVTIVRVRHRRDVYHQARL
jgi:mRNA interferase RelE/StbE